MAVERRRAGRAARACAASCPRVPGALIVVVGAIGVSWALDLAGHGVAIVGPVAERPAAADACRRRRFGDVARARAGGARRLPRLVRRRDPDRARVRRQAPRARARVAGAAGDGRGERGRRASRRRSRSARAARAPRSTRRWARARRSPACSRPATIVVILLFLTEPVQYLPKAVLGAVIVVGRRSASSTRPPGERWPRSTASRSRSPASPPRCVVIFGVLQALVVAVGLSIIDTVRRSARPYDAVLGWVPRARGYRDVSLHPSARVTPGVVVYRLDDRLFFANASYVKGRVREAIRAAPTETSWLVFDAEAVNHVDSTGIEALARPDPRPAPRADHARRRAAAVADRTEFDVAGLTDEIGPEHFYPSVKLAVAAFARIGRTPRTPPDPAGSRFWQDARGATPTVTDPRRRSARRGLSLPGPALDDADLLRLDPVVLAPLHRLRGHLPPP